MALFEHNDCSGLRVTAGAFLVLAVTGLIVCTFVISAVVPLARLEGNFVFSAFDGVDGNEASGEFNAEPCDMPCRLRQGVVVPRPSPDIKMLLAKGDSGYVTDGNGFVASDEGIFRANDTLSSLTVAPSSPFIWKVKILWKRLLDESSVDVVPEILGGSRSGAFRERQGTRKWIYQRQEYRGQHPWIEATKIQMRAGQLQELPGLSC